MKPIGVDLPLRRGNQGFFQQTLTTENAIKTNLRNFLLTNFGERPLNPTFGANLRQFVFDQDVEIKRVEIEETIRELVSNNFESVSIERVDFDESRDDNLINLSISFSITSIPDSLDTLNLRVNTGI
jgi:phage baseplate assembly protein W